MLRGEARAPISSKPVCGWFPYCRPIAGIALHLRNRLKGNAFRLYRFWAESGSSPLGAVPYLRNNAATESTELTITTHDVA